MVSDEHIRKFKEIMEKKEGREVSWEEASEGAHNLTSLVKLLYDCWVEDKRREAKLRDSPKGFPLVGSYSCLLCGEGGDRNGGIWYDKWGQKCMVCQGATERGEVPGWAAKHHDSWYSKYDLESRFNLKTVHLKKWIKEGIIKPRNVMRDGRVHTQIFLIYDNKGFLPPKRLTKSELVCEEKDGQKWYRSEPWFRFVDPFEHLKDYRIMEYMRRTDAVTGRDSDTGKCEE